MAKMELAANLDSMSPDELREYAETLGALMEYAVLKANAIEYRVSGNIPDAMKLETHCNEVYNSLPAWARAW